jgi:hypothetical protein
LVERPLLSRSHWSQSRLSPLWRPGYSIRTPIAFYDANDNGVPGPDPDFDPTGPFWDASHTNRLNEAVAEWTSDTDYDPGVATTSNDVFVDGRLPGAPCLSTWNPGGGFVTLAVTCTFEHARNNATWGNYSQIFEADMYFNMELASSPDWWVGSAMNTDPQRIDFGGTLTHEIGHTGGLQHTNLSCTTHTSSAWVTMCPSVGATGHANQDSYWQRSLHSDDVNSINTAYP